MQYTNVYGFIIPVISSYYASIILDSGSAYYAQNYAGIIDTGLIVIIDS